MGIGQKFMEKAVLSGIDDRCEGAWDRIRELHPSVRRYMDRMEVKILRRVLTGSKAQMGCLVRYPVANVFDHPETEFVYKESDGKRLYQVVSSPRSAPEFEEEKKEVYYFPDYIATLRDVELIPCTDAVIKDGVILSDRFEFDKHYNVTLLMWRIAFDKEHIVLKNRRTESLKGEYIDMCYAGEGNIWHMTHWMLSKMQMINSCDSLKKVPLLMDEHIKTNEFAQQYIACLNQDRHRIVYVRKGRRYRIETLHVISGSGAILYLEPKHPNKWVSVFSGKIVTYFRRMMAERMQETKQKRKFFIRRGDKRLINEEEVISYLSKKDFEVVQPEKLPFIEELNLFYNAECIVGASGAGLTNVIYAPEKCSIICIASKEAVCEVSNLANNVQDFGAKVYFCPAKAVLVDGVVNPKSFRVKIGELEKVYNHIYPDAT